MIKDKLNIPELGIIILEKRKGQKSMRIRLHPVKGLVLSLPYHISKKQAKNFVISNIDVIKERLIKPNKNIHNNIFKEGSTFETKRFRLNLKRFDGDGATATFHENGELELLVSNKIDINNLDLQNFIQKQLLKILELEAHDYLPQRLNEISKKTGLKAGNLKIGKASRSWGSCKSDNSIILSCRLMMLPPKLIDYIIIHELCHTIHKNHGKEFYKLLDYHSNGKHNELKKELSQYSTKLIPGNYIFT